MRLREGLPLAALLALGLVLRFYHLGTVPRPNETADEYFWTWGGMTLLHEGVPRSWSWLSPYRDTQTISWRGAPYRLVRPNLDHPPLYHLFMCVWMTLFGERDILGVDLWVMRLSSLLLFAASFVLLALNLRRFCEPAAVGLGLLAYTVAPPAVVNSRLVVSENLFVPLFLLGWYFLQLHADRPSRGRLAVVASVALLLPLVKIAALALSLALLGMAAVRRSRPLALATAGGTVLGLALYFAYGLHFGGHGLFLDVLTAHRERFSGFDGFFDILFVGKLVNSVFIYLPFVLGAVVLFGDLAAGEALDLPLQLAAYAAAMTFFMDKNNVYGWYALPTYPALAAGVGRFGARVWREGGGPKLVLWSLFALPYVFGSAYDHHWLGTRELRWPYLAAISAVPVGLALVAPLRRAGTRGLAALALAAPFVVDVANSVLR